MHVVLPLAVTFFALTASALGQSNSFFGWPLASNSIPPRDGPPKTAVPTTSNAKQGQIPMSQTTLTPQKPSVGIPESGSSSRELVPAAASAGNFAVENVKCLPVVESSCP